MNATERLFIGVYPAGIVYADRSRERAGDYCRLGFLSYRTLELELEKDCPPALAELIQADAVRMQARRGELYPISASGQTVRLGGRDSAPDSKPGPYQPLTGAACGCKRGQQRDNCPNCEGTGRAIDFAAIRALRPAPDSGPRP